MYITNCIRRMEGFGMKEEEEEEREERLDHHMTLVNDLECISVRCFHLDEKLKRSMDSN